MSFGEIWINVAWSTNKQTQESARWWSVSDVISLQACRTIEYWCLSLRGHCLCCQMIRRKQMKIFLECASWWRWWGQTCSSWLLPGRHLKGFFLVDEHWEQRILPNLGERRAAKNSDKAMTHLLWPFSFVSKRCSLKKNHRTKVWHNNHFLLCFILCLSL